MISLFHERLVSRVEKKDEFLGNNPNSDANCCYRLCKHGASTMAVIPIVTTISRWYGILQQCERPPERVTRPITMARMARRLARPPELVGNAELNVVSSGGRDGIRPSRTRSSGDRPFVQAPFE